MGNDTGFIKTKDTEEASFYWTLDGQFELDHVETTDHFGRIIVWFVFKTNLRQAELEKLKNDYLNGKCLVEPRKFSYRRSEVKSIIREKYTLG